MPAFFKADKKALLHSFVCHSILRSIVVRQNSIVIPSGLQRVRELVLSYGWNTTAYQILNPGISHWFAAAGDAVIGYVERHGVRIVAGAPVCPEGRLADVMAEFEHASAANHLRVCYFCAESRVEAALGHSGRHSMVLLGAQPAWRPQAWPHIYEHHGSLKAQLNRARNKAVTVNEWLTDRASRAPELLHCLREWLAARKFPTLHFLVEPMTLERLYDRRVFVAERQNRVIGFVVASPVPKRNGWLIEQIIRGQGAVNGTSELMIDTAVRTLAAGGCGFITMGLSPLSRRANVERPPKPLRQRRIQGWVRAHGPPFYNVHGIEAIKTKFHPDHWEPIFAIANESHFSPLTLYAVAAAFTQDSPIAASMRAILDAVGTEMRWLTEKRR
jgi:phosphatidylglycerol lysyltransferase